MSTLYTELCRCYDTVVIRTWHGLGSPYNIKLQRHISDDAEYEQRS